MVDRFDFSGWATKNDLQCSDGRIIKRDAFKASNGKKVPLVWNHQHNDCENVLGHAILENREDGVYAYCTLNDTEAGRNAKLLVKHGDISQLSIWANHLKQEGNNVLHGAIREVSLVLAGANPGAFIETVMCHDDTDEEDAIIYTGEWIDIQHSVNSEGDTDIKPKKKKKASKPAEVKETSEEEQGTDDNIKHADNEDNEESVYDVYETMNEKQKNIIAILASVVIASRKKQDSENMEHTDDELDVEDIPELEEGETIRDIYNTMTEKQKSVVPYIISVLVDEAIKSENNQNEKETEEMKQNAFESQGKDTNTNVLSHSEIGEIFEDAKRYGSLKESVLAHSQEYGIENIDVLFPDAQMVQDPDFIKRDDAWVSSVLDGAKHSPFAKVKSIHANITEEDARAKGYIKGNRKAEEVFPLLKRVTTPTTIYKKQALDRDDIVDITEFKVVTWLKAEMRMMFNEEIARAALVGDGRSAASPDKISALNIRPIWTDDDLYTVKHVINMASTATDQDKAKAFIKGVIKSRKLYKGSGNPVLYTTEDMLTDCLLIEDTTGRVIYDTIDKLKNQMRVSDIITVPVMEGLTREVEGDTHNLEGIIVNMKDYNFGADKGGEINMFDDFDIDYNKEKYLMETRCSGALVKPYSAIVVESVFQ